MPHRVSFEIAYSTTPRRSGADRCSLSDRRLTGIVELRLDDRPSRVVEMIVRQSRICGRTAEDPLRMPTRSGPLRPPALAILTDNTACRSLPPLGALFHHHCRPAWRAAWPAP